jgi:hypothetical protein
LKLAIEIAESGKKLEEDDPEYDRIFEGIEGKHASIAYAALALARGRYDRAAHCAAHLEADSEVLKQIRTITNQTGEAAAFDRATAFKVAFDASISRQRARLLAMMQQRRAQTVPDHIGPGSHLGGDRAIQVSAMVAKTSA